MIYKYIKYLIFALAIILSVPGHSAINIAFPGVSHKVLNVEPEKKTGLDMVYVVYNISEVSSIELTGVTGDLTVSRYSNLGGGYSEPVTIRWDGLTAYIDNPPGDMGFILTDGGKTQYFWIVDYTKHRFSLTSVVPLDIQECDNTRFNLLGDASAIHFYTIDGRPEVLSRDIEVSFATLEWSEQDLSYGQINEVKNFEDLGQTMTIMPALYCSTQVTVSGDRFLKEWGEEISVATSTIQPNGIEAHTTAEQTNLPDDTTEDYQSNIIAGEGNGLGGSAPAVIKFTAYTTEAVIHHEWQMTQDPQFENIEYRFNEQEIEYTFDTEGVYYIRYVGSNSDGSCEYYGDTYTVSIGASELRIPNAFSPNDDGVNDVWKVGYRSLTSFKCWITDRYGNQIYYFDDPNEGWDGTYKGKKVKGGVYFYVIEAKGADGKKYKKGGDINIVMRKRGGTGVVEQ